MKAFLLRMIVVAVLAMAVLVLLQVWPQATAAQSPLEARVLVWESTPEDDGQVSLITSDQQESVLVDFPAGVYNNWAKACSQDYWSAGGKGIALFTGAAEGEIAIYDLAEDNLVISLGQANRMACAGPETFQFSSSRQRVGYINFAADAVDREFPYGDLQVFDARDGTLQGSFDWTTAFELYDDGALMLRLYPDGKGYASESDVDWWDGSARRTLVTLEPVYPEDRPDLDCGITGGSVARVGDTAYVLAGQKCEDGASSWRLLSVPTSGGDATEIVSGVPGGGYFPESFTTRLIPTKDGMGFLMSMPSGLARNTVRLQWVTLDGSVTPLLDGYHVLADRFGERLSEGRHMMLSMDGATLAFVTVTGAQQQALWLLDMSTPGGDPMLVDEQGANERIFHYVWAANNNLYYAAGGVESNSLQKVAPDGSSQRLERGRFFQIAVSYSGEKIAAAEWFANPNSVGDDLFKLTVLDVNGTTAILKTGGEDHNQLRPLAIR